MQHFMKPRAVALAVSSLFMLVAGQTALADSTDDLLKKLKDKGILSEQEYDEFNSTRDTEKKKKSSEIKASFKDGVTFESGDKSTQISVNGRVQLDYRNFDHTDGVVNADTFDIRRAYLGVKGKFYNDYDFEVTYDAGGGGGATLDVAYLGINWWDQARFRFGQFKMPMSMEENGSSRFLDFQERSFVNGLVPAKERGAMLHGKVTSGLYYALAASTGRGKNNNETTVTAANGPSDGNDIIGRVYANFAEMMGDKSNVYHVGASFSTGDIVGNTGALSQRTEGRGISFFNTGAFANPGEIERKRYQLEAALALGPVKVQGEYVTNNYNGTDTGGSFDRDINAWYAEALWLITGENYADAYKDGAFGGRIKPKNDFVHPSAAASGGGWGAWEIGVRRSRFDASDFLAATATTGGAAVAAGSTTEADAWTLGLKWIPNPNTRFLMNYVKTDFGTPVTVNGVTVSDEKALTMRAQFDF